jgi:hypothetical protein
MPDMFVKWLVLCFSLVFSVNLLAQSQTSVKKWPVGDYTTYEFSWTDRRGESYQTRARFHNQDLQVGSTEMAPGDSTITITYRDGEDPKKILAEELKKRKKIARADGSVIHDYVGLKWRYQAVMKNLALALNQQAPRDPRAKIEFFVDFLRQFKYTDTFQNGSDFQSPVGVLTENAGDCDSLSVAFASMLANLNIPVAFIMVPGHMFVGVALSPQKGDQYMNYGGRSYVFIDLTWYGSPTGKLSEENVGYLKAGNYDFLF